MFKTVLPVFLILTFNTSRLLATDVKRFKVSEKYCDDQRVELKSSENIFFFDLVNRDGHVNSFIAITHKDENSSCYLMDTTSISKGEESKSHIFEANSSISRIKECDGSSKIETRFSEIEQSDSTPEFYVFDSIKVVSHRVELIFTDVTQNGCSKISFKVQELN